MKVKALNCPNCGAGVAENLNYCVHCTTRLKTMSCTSCLETIFEGNKFCPLCGAKAVEANLTEKEAGDCPRCKTGLQVIEVGEIHLSECEQCEGVWLDVDTFETICANKENQAAVIRALDDILKNPPHVKVQYVPCPQCETLMNRSNFAKVSGVVIDSCKGHGVWFDANELPQIIEFIRKGGMEYSRQKDKAYIDSERSKLRAEKFKQSVDRFKHESKSNIPISGNTAMVREFIDFIIS